MKSRLGVHLLVAGCLVLAIPLLAVSTVHGFQPGANGSNGVDGDPGTDGQDGEKGSDVEGVPGLIYSAAIGNNGGNGGNGGNGVDGDDEGSDAAGGNSGSGGHGGNATAEFVGVGSDPFQRIAFAVAGNGGSGGMFGRGTAPLLNGFGGNGGNGGNAYAYAMDDFDRSIARAIGGNGGNAYGPTALAGNGGQAFTRASTAAMSTKTFPSLTAIKLGGSGGTGFIGATGGDGATVTFGNDDEFEIGNPVDGTFGSVFMRGTAGTGGSSYNGSAGKAGDASVNLPGIKQQAWTVTPTSRTAGFVLTGGYGGKGIATGNQNVSGAHGGHAVAMGETTFESLGYGNYQFDLRGGNGGSAIGGRNTGNGGNGGQATTDAVAFDNTFASPYISTINVNAEFTGGDGGHANGSGRAGHGASVELANKLTLAVKSEGRLFIQANGGNGGWGRYNGNGGDAIIDSNQAVSQTLENGSGVTWISHRANGGNAGLGVAGLNSASGGNAWASAVQENINRLSMDVTSISGIGNLGKSGDAYARADATTTGGGESNRYQSSAYASAEAPMISDFDRVLPSIGTNATAEANAKNHSNSNSSAGANAVGGWGFLQSGYAQSTATAESGGSGNADSFSNSFAYGDRDAQTENYSTSHASSKSLNRAEARSVAESVGHFTQTHATASIDGKFGSAYSETQSKTTNWAHEALITNNAKLHHIENTSKIDSSSYFGFRETGFADTAEAESSVDLLLIPDRSFADSVVAGSGIEDVFGPDADLLGLGSIGGGYAGDTFQGRLEIDSGIDMSLQLQPFHDDKNLMLGLFGVESTGNGFEDLSFSVSYMGRSVIDESFTSLSDATQFFDDHLFNLDELNNLETLIELQFDFSMNIDDSADSFRFDFVFGNADPAMGPQPLTLGGSNGGASAVPEPASGIVIGLTVLVFVNRRRRSG